MTGIYDSGIGGLSVWKELRILMPEQDYVYVADSAHCPYGDKSTGYIRERACAVVRFLIGKGAEAVVVACNTATAAAISYLRSHFKIPFVGMEPAIKPAALASKTGVVGVLATANTFRGSLYHDTVMKYATGVHIVEKVGWGLVEAVERGEVPTDQIRKYVGDMVEAGADVIVLGCTHFPFLQDEIARVAGPSVRIINPAPAVAMQTRRVLMNSDSGRGKTLSSGAEPSSSPYREFCSTGDTSVLQRTAMAIDPSLAPDMFKHITI